MNKGNIAEEKKTLFPLYLFGHEGNITSAISQRAREQRLSKILQIKVAIKLSINGISKHHGGGSLLIRAPLF